MNSDPTGYFTLSELAVVKNIKAVLSNMNTATFLVLLNKANIVVTVYDMIAQVIELVRDDDGSALEVAMAVGRGIITGIFINKMCALKAIGPVISKVVIGYGLMMQVESILDAIDEKRWDLVAERTIRLFAQLVSLGQSCFAGDTLVATKEGQKPIEEIEVGDEVWSYNVETGEAKLNKVVKVFIYETDVLVHLHTESAIIDTKTHPFYVEGRGFVAAVDLQEGDKII